MDAILPRVRILATGGTISRIGRHRLDYVAYTETGRQLTIQEMLARIPEVTEIARVEAEQFTNIASPAMTPQHLIGIAQGINHYFRIEPDLSGVVVTHGTATMEEIAYFLNLTVIDTRPVILTGAMRPPSVLGTDADVNLLAAIRTAISPSAVDRGVMVVFNDEISAAREVSKANTYRVETFKPGELGLLGYADSDGAIVFYRSPTRRHTHQSTFEVDRLKSLPRVDVVYVYQGADGLLVDCLVERGVEGIVIASVGGGSLTPGIEKAAARAVQRGIAVVISSRVGHGRVLLTPARQALGVIAGDNLNPQKARVLLMLALATTHDPATIQGIFNEY